MEETLDESLYQAVCREDIAAVDKLIARGACANVTSSSGKTALGAAASLGDIDILQSLLEGAHSSCAPPPQTQTWDSPSVPSTYQHQQYKSLTEVESQPCGYVLSPVNLEKYPSVVSVIEEQPYSLYPVDYSNPNQGYFICIHEDSSSMAQSPDWGAWGADGLEWDEDVGTEALPTTEDETWASLYRWYAHMLEQTEGLLGDNAAGAPRARAETTFDSRDTRQRSAAHYAAEQGHTGALRLLLHAGCSPNAVDDTGLTPLHLAVDRGHIGATKLLLAAGADPSRCILSTNRSSPLHIAAARGHLRIMEILLAAGGVVDLQDGTEKTPLLLATEKNQVEAALLLLRNGASLNREDIRGTTPLCEAVWVGEERLVAALLNAGARAPPHHHLLHYSILHRQAAVARLLIEAGGCVDLRDDNGDTPLLLAARSGQPDVARILLKNGASVDYPNSLTGSTALHEAVECVADFTTFKQIFVELLEYSVNLNAISLTGGDTPLFRSILLQRDKAAKLLIKHGADVNLCSLQHCVVDNLSLALRRSGPCVARMLVLAGATAPLDWGQRTPRPLTHIARICLRANLRRTSLIRSVEVLPLPTTLKSFLMLDGEE